MSRRPKTRFDAYFAAQMENPEFAKEYATARREIDQVDQIVRALDVQREAAGLTKTELARRVGMKPEVVRRLFTADEPNPTLETVVRLAQALDCTLGLAPAHGRRVRKLAARVVRR